MSTRRILMLGNKYGALTVTAELPAQRVRYRCECGCEGEGHGFLLRSGKTTSCGCQRADKIGARLKRHGQTDSPTYRAWQSIMSRCNCPSDRGYYKYGARGIKVSDEWRSFEAFRADMGERPSLTHSIDRIDNAKGYSRDNCRWATPREQAQNRRTNRVLEFRGERRCLLEWARHVGIHWATINSRIAAGWSIERAMTEPVRGRA